MNEVDRDLIQNINRIEPTQAVKKYGEKGKKGVFEITSRKLYTDKVKVKSTSENDKIDTELKLRKFIAGKIRYPKDAQEAGMTGTASVILEIDNNGSVKIVKKIPDFKLDEIVVVGYGPKTKSTEKAEMKVFEKETERVGDLVKQIDIEKFKGKTVLAIVKFRLQD